MRYLKLILAFLVFGTAFLNAQVEIDSIQLNQIIKDKLYRIEQWENDRFWQYNFYL